MLVHVQKSQVGAVTCLLPETDEDLDAIHRMKLGETYRFDFKLMRNGQFHRKLFAMFAIVFEHMSDDAKAKFNITDKNKTMLRAIKFLVGHYELAVTIDGKAMYEPMSIDFASMDDIEFSGFYNRCVDAVYTHFMLSLDRHRLEALVLKMTGFSQ